jgi:hypothetical protein
MSHVAGSHSIPFLYKFKQLNLERGCQGGRAVTTRWALRVLEDSAPIKTGAEAPAKDDADKTLRTASYAQAL